MAMQLTCQHETGNLLLQHLTLFNKNQALQITKGSSASDFLLSLRTFSEDLVSQSVENERKKKKIRRLPSKGSKAPLEVDWQMLYEKGSQLSC